MYLRDLVTFDFATRPSEEPEMLIAAKVARFDGDRLDEVRAEQGNPPNRNNSRRPDTSGESSSSRKKVTLVSFATLPDSPVCSSLNVQHEDGQSEKSGGPRGEAAQSDCDIKPDNSAPLVAVQLDEGYRVNDGTSHPNEPGHSKYRAEAQTEPVQDKKSRPRSRAARSRKKENKTKTSSSRRTPHEGGPKSRRGGGLLTFLEDVYSLWFD